MTPADSGSPSPNMAGKDPGGLAGSGAPGNTRREAQWLGWCLQCPTRDFCRQTLETQEAWSDAANINWDVSCQEGELRPSCHKEYRPTHWTVLVWGNLLTYNTSLVGEFCHHPGHILYHNHHHNQCNDCPTLSKQHRDTHTQSLNCIQVTTVTDNNTSNFSTSFASLTLLSDTCFSSHKKQHLWVIL